MTDQTKTPGAIVPTTVSQKLWQLQVFLDAAGLHEQSDLAFAAIKQIYADQESAPQPPALGGAPEVFAWAESVEEPGPLGGIVTNRFKQNCVHADGSPGGMSYTRPLILLSDHRAYLAPLQAEIERLRHRNGIFGLELTNEGERRIKAEKERDQLKARNAELECDHEWTDDGEFNLRCTKCGKQENHEPYGWVQTRGNAINHFTQEWDVVEEWEAQGFEYKAMFDTALSKPAEGEQV